MDETDPRWEWWTDAIETVAERLTCLKRPEPNDSWQTIDRRIAKWLGRLHESGLWLGIKTLQTALNVRRAALEVQHNAAGALTRMSITVPIRVPHAQTPFHADTQRADLTIARAGEGR